MSHAVEQSMGHLEIVSIRYLTEGAAEYTVS